MQVIDNDHVACFDVDDTLINWYWGYDLELARQEGLTLEISDGKFSNSVVPNKNHIELLKRYKGKGKTIIVWTAAGYEWGKRVVEALGLTEYVDFVMTKPEKYVDDLHADEWMEYVYKGKSAFSTPEGQHE